MPSNRSKAKWAPFNAVVPGDEMIKDVLKKKNVVKMPILSDDQIAEIERSLINNEDFFNSFLFFHNTVRIT